MDQEISPSADAQENVVPLFELDNVLKECNKTFRIEASFMEDLQQSGSFADETTKTPKCYVRCLLDLTGVTELEDGKYDPEQAALLFDGQLEGTQKNDVEEMAKACMENRDEDLCNRAYAFVKCVLAKKRNKIR
ncbi:uncharacterized protein LOC113236092 [Hyposmocoma kahamanoa]|uniref:uncharacterized protein LOC113236092 n=1 Tax=Hyposmocoma kahamanoa TaxID=1477025 RepID=UPI000E6D6513|nr:uncharacterized protein LOC113236092 [Hyposmocoma kahamanoa]